MVRRADETFRFDTLIVGDEYKKSDLVREGQVEPLVVNNEWTGIVEFANCILLFSTLNKKDLPKEYGYEDLFEVPKFYWQSQNQNHQGSRIIERIISLDTPVLLFCRLESRGSFVFVGHLSAEDFDGERPVSMQFSLDDYVENPPEQLRALYEWRPGVNRKLKPIEAPDRKPRVRISGQGRQSDPRKRKAVELRAMVVAQEYYEKRGYSVTDTSANNPYDLQCTNGSETRRIEVKGLTGSLGPVEVTIGEVLSARNTDCETDLFIVYSIALVETESSKIEGEGGKTHVLDNWTPGDDALEPIRFRFIIS